MATPAHAAAEQSAGMPQLDFSTYPAQIFWAAVALFVLYRYLSRRAIPQMEAALAARHEAIGGSLEAAAAARREAGQAEADYQKSLAEARARAQATLAEAKARSDAALAARLAEADASIAGKTAAGEARIAGIRASAETDVRSVASEAAAAILERFLPGKADAAEVSRAVEDGLAGLKRS
ncbi:F0F1 ATP synthase subunit B' [Neomegalonema sp.]|uniref:F0F1 ATP synthase subunit B family protein n=1 Tax=Neomegalonema sp. TaxID=2039713 RepID=UPI00262D0CA9|nr:F0F1 ATP synthase subunit B' [Neomegalonema sp.]MDD2869082.1 F0F1 ATP synthase subunit B' [Neomegalonema sp.]